MFDEKIRQDMQKWNSEEFIQDLKDGDIEAYAGNTTLCFFKKDIDQDSPAYKKMIDDEGQKIEYSTAIEIIRLLKREIKDIEYNNQIYQ